MMVVAIDKLSCGEHFRNYLSCTFYKFRFNACQSTERMTNVVEFTFYLLLPFQQNCFYASRLSDC